MKRADRPQRAAAARYVAYTRKIRAEAELELLIARGMDAWADVLQHSIVSRITAGGPLERADALNHVDEAARAWLVFLQHGLLPRLAALFREAFTEQRTQLPGALTAAAEPEDDFERAFRAELDAINSGGGDPFSGPEAQAYEAEAEALFGEEFNAERKSADHSAYRYEQEHIAQVHDRLVIWPDGAWEEMRPEIEEALAEGESINQVRDRIAYVIGTDSETRRIRADIADIDRELMRTDLTSNERAELQARRRTLWQQHDESTDDWEYNARRVARTEVQMAVEGGHYQASVAAEAETGVKMWRRWLSTPDDRTRWSHRVADGQMVKSGELFQVGTAKLRFPGDPTCLDGSAVINCRCTLLAFPWSEVQEEIAGEEGSLGEVRPGGVRLGPDDETAVQAAIEAEKQAQREWDAENSGFTAAATASGPHDEDGMVALVPTSADAERLAVAGGEPAAELHVTLAYFPDADRMDPGQLAASVAAAFPGPVRGEVSGRADFTGGDRPCAVYLVQAPGLAAAHDALAPEGGTFDAYVPHITAGYDMGAASLTESGPVTFDRARISVRGQTQDIPLGGSLTAAGRKGFNPAQRRGGDGRWSIDLGGGDTHVNRPARPIREPSATGRGSIPQTAREKAVHPHGLPKLSEPQMIDRQSRLGIETNGETLEQHEIEFVERMNALDQDVEWLAKSTRHQGAGLTPTSDFIWRSNGGMPTELKSTGTDPHGVGRRISDSVKRSSRHGEEYRKRNFIVDLGDAELSPELRGHLEQYNENRRFQAERMKVKPKGAPYTINRLWVMSQGRLNPIHLQ